MSEPFFFVCPDCHVAMVPSLQPSHACDAPRRAAKTARTGPKDRLQAWRGRRSAAVRAERNMKRDDLIRCLHGQDERPSLRKTAARVSEVLGKKVSRTTVARVLGDEPKFIWCGSCNPPQRVRADRFSDHHEAVHKAIPLFQS